jgi:hypothetical protein
VRLLQRFGVGIILIVVFFDTSDSSFLDGETLSGISSRRSSDSVLDRKGRRDSPPFSVLAVSFKLDGYRAIAESRWPGKSIFAAVQILQTVIVPVGDGAQTQVLWTRVSAFPDTVPARTSIPLKRVCTPQ